MKPTTKIRFTEKEGQYLAFIYFYTRMMGVPPAEADFQRHFQVSPPTVHDTIVRLTRKGLITREPGKARSIRNVLPREELPDLI